MYEDTISTILFEVFHPYLSRIYRKRRHFEYMFSSFNRYVFYVFLLRRCILLCRSIWVGSLHWLLIIRCALLRKNGWDGIRIISVVQQQHKISSITFLIWVIWTSKYFPVVRAYPPKNIFMKVLVFIIRRYVIDTRYMEKHLNWIMRNC